MRSIPAPERSIISGGRPREERPKGVTKVCRYPECHSQGQPQPLTEFYKDRAKPDGYRFYCISCERAGHRKHRKGEVWSDSYAAVMRRNRVARRRERAVLEVPPTAPKRGKSYRTGGKGMYPRFRGLHGTSGRWSDDENAYLEEYYGLALDEHLEAQLGRSRQATLSHASRALGLHKCDNVLTIRVVADILRVAWPTARRFVREGLLVKLPRPSFRGGALYKGSPTTCIHPAALSKFLVEHPHKYDYKRMNAVKYPQWVAEAKAAHERAVAAGAPPCRAAWKRWLPNEDAYLVRNYESLPYKAIGAYLGRSEQAVRTRLATLRAEKLYLLRAKPRHLRGSRPTLIRNDYPPRRAQKARGTVRGKRIA